MKQKFFVNTTQSKKHLCGVIQALPEKPAHTVEIKKVRANRTILQNGLMWSVLTDLSRQIEYYNNKYTKEQWKLIIVKSMKLEKKQGMEIVPAIGGGGFIDLGGSTSDMSIQEMGDVITFAHAFGAEHGVEWSPTSIGREVKN